MHHISQEAIIIIMIILKYGSKFFFFKFTYLKTIRFRHIFYQYLSITKERRGKLIHMGT